MSWLFSQALAAEFLADNCLDGEQYAPLKTIPMPQVYCAPGKMMEFSRLSRFGMMFEHLTESLGEELLTWFQEAFPAKIYRLLEKEQDLMERKADCGLSSLESLAKFDHNTYSWKIPQCLLFGDLIEFSVIWPRWGTMRNGECWELPRWERHINGNEFGLWATPNAFMQVEITRERALELDWVWKGTAWYAKDGVKKNSSLTHQVKIWATPISRDYRSGMSKETLLRRQKESNRGVNLSEQMQRVDGNNGKLNPTWVELLMGWPKNWTSLNSINRNEFKLWLNKFSNCKIEAWRNGQWENGIPRTITIKMITRTNRLKTIGNGQVPLCAAKAWRQLQKKRYKKGK